MTKVLILYYSSWGHVETMAGAVAEGVRAAGAEAVVKRVPELVPEAVAKQSNMKLDQAAPIAVPSELADYDAVIVGAPTRYGTVASQMRNFLDQTGGLWAQGKLVGKVGSAFISTGTGGGNESTLQGLVPFFLHHGMVYVGLPYSAPDMTNLSEVKGGSPFGAGTIAGADGSRQPSGIELAQARFQGQHVAQIAAKLKA